MYKANQITFYTNECNFISHLAANGVLLLTNKVSTYIYFSKKDMRYVRT